MATRKEIKTDQQYIRALIKPNSFDKEKRTFDVTFASETPVRLYNLDIGEFDEILSCDPKNVRMERAKNGLPVFDSHYPRTAMVQLGRADNIRFENGQAVATITLGARADEAFISDLENGIISGISVGYRVYMYDGKIEKDKTPQLRATDWEPLEISFAPVQADPKSKIRSENSDSIQTIINLNSEKMDEETVVSEETREQKPANPAVATPAEKVDVAKVRKEASEAERGRLDAILKSTRAAKLEDSFAIELFTSEKTIEECRQAVIEKYVKEDPKVDGNHGAGVGKEGIDKKREAVEEVLLSRVMPSKFKADGKNEFRGLSLIEIVRELAAERGVSLKGMDKIQVTDFAFGKRTIGTSDFPLLLENLADKLLRADYQLAPEYWQMIARETSVVDFKEKALYQVDSVNGMKEIAEGGEIQYTQLVESKQTIKVKKYAEGIKFTREAFINDDLNAFALIPNKFVVDWNTLRGDIVWALITGNVKLADGKELFHADHKNLQTANLDEAGLTAADILFMNQTGIDGKRKIRVMPKYLIVSPNLKITAKKLMTAITASKTGDVNVFNGAYEPIVEPRLTGLDWYLAADPAMIEGLYYCYLNGNSGLRSNREESFDSDSIKFAVRGEFGAQAIDYRGWMKSKGAAQG